MTTILASLALREATAWLYDAIAATPGYTPIHEHLRSALGQGKVWAGLGRSSGEGRALQATQEAVANLGKGWEHCGYLFMAVCSSEELNITEYSQAVMLVEAEAALRNAPSPKVELTLSNSFGEEMRVILLATENSME